MNGGSYSSISEVACLEDGNSLQATVKRALKLLAEPGPDSVKLENIKAVLEAALDSGVSAPQCEMPLNPRQRETLSFLVVGLSNRLIAKRMGVDEEVVKGQVRALLDRLGMRNRTALALWAVRNGVVPVADCG